MSPWTHVVGWTLIHFVWQGALLAIAAAAGLYLCRRRAPSVRYAVACAALAAMVAAPLVTARLLVAPGPAFHLAADSSAPLLVSPELGAPGVVSAVDTLRGSTIGRTVDAALPVAVWIWLACVTALLTCTAGGWWRVRRLFVASRAMAPSRWQATGEAVAGRLGLRAAVLIVESALVDTPTLVGWLRPVILLPIAAVAGLTPDQVQAILAHELAHVRRHDYVVNLVQTLAETFLFYHPAVWWVSARIRSEREYCCDDAAVAVCGDAVGYVSALASLESWRTIDSGLSLAATDGQLLARIRRLLRGPVADEAQVPGWATIVAFLLVGAVGAGGAQQLRSRGAVPVPPAPPIVDSRPRSIESPEPSRPASSPIAAAQAPATRLRDQWRMRDSEHFDLYYGADLEGRVQDVGEQAERAYRQISEDLRHDLGFRVPLVLFNTRRQLQQLLQSQSSPAVDATFGTRSRLMLPIDSPSFELYGLISHELTHQFEFDILPQSSGGRAPVWVLEGLADYERGSWTPRDVGQMRELAAGRLVPPLTAPDSDGDRTTRRADNLGHAAFEFIEATHGKNGIRQFLFALRMKLLGSGADEYESAFHVSAEQFDLAFERYLAERFPKPPPPPPGPLPNRGAQ